MRIAATNTRFGCSAMRSACRRPATMLGARDRRARVRRRTGNCSMTSGGFTPITASAMERRASMPPCGHRAGPSAGGVSNASCTVMVFAPSVPGPSGSAPPTAITPCRSPPTSWTATSLPPLRTRSGSPTSPTCQPTRAGCTWQWCWICSAARRLGGRCAIICAPNCRWRRSPWPSSRSPASSPSSLSRPNGASWSRTPTAIPGTSSAAFSPTCVSAG
ncbi:hypothetical protein FH063_003209 [Azospirillum argentinense]|uniref:Uncharacterized protein n=1 Tax=Azospirillum argentinense TaxID=2970906 RepID=A0A5B0KME9_9PROT|nr:hypothetical protein FH063_003209 [Azospirillum argentinense]